MAIHLDVVTPDGSVLSVDADYIGIPGMAGQFGVMPGHIPMLSAITVGDLYYRIGNTQKDIFVSGGFAEISGSKVVILAESAEEKESINLERAEAARKRAEERLAKAKSDDHIDIDRAKASLTRAIMRISIASR